MMIAVKQNTKNNHSGVAAMEASLTIPIIFSLIFFTLELIKLNNVRTAMDSMALEATMEFIARKSVSNFASIIKKHKPMLIPESNIKYYFTVYNSLEKMCSVPPYGSEEVFWPNTTTYSVSNTFLDSNGDGSFLSRNTTNGYIALNNQFDPLTTASISTDRKISGKAFVLTFVCDFNFSCDFVKKLFAGGSNTVDGKKFLIWGRGVGICD